MAGREPRTPREDVTPGTTEPGTNVLVHAAGDDAPAGLCDDLRATGDPTGDVLVVEFERDPVGRLDYLENHPSTGRKRLLAVGGDAEPRSTRADVTVESIAEPADLSSLGIAISGFLDDSPGPDGETIVCFHSVTALLAHVDLERAFRFLHVLSSRIRSANAVAHYHVDPNAHDARTLNTLAALFDGIVERFDGDWTLRPVR